MKKRVSHYQVNEQGNLVHTSHTITRRRPIAPISVAGEIIGRTWVFWVGEEEVVLLRVNKSEHNFKVERSGKMWMITVSDRNLCEGTFATNYLFGEPLKVKCLASEQDEYLPFAELVECDPDELLILERVNKSQ